MIQQYTKIICLLLYIFCCNQNISSKERYLPEKITDNETFILKIFYDDANRIKGIHTETIFPDGQTQKLNSVYEYYPDGLLKVLKSETTIQSDDSTFMNVTSTDKYNYVISDTVISITFEKNKKINDELYTEDTLLSSKIYLDERKFLNKIVAFDGYNNFMTTTDTIEYCPNNQIVKTEQTMINKWGDIHIYVCNEVLKRTEQKNIFSDITKSKFMQIPLERQWFYFFADEAPILVKYQSKIQEDKEVDTQNTQFIYKLDDKGYPIEIHAITTKNDNEPQESTLFVKYKKVNN